MDSNDIIFFIGILIMAIGLWLWNPALSLTATGVILMAIGWLRAGGD